MRGLDDKAAIVTGGGGSIGRAISLRLASAGCSVAVFDLAADAARETVAMIERQGGSAVARAVDVSSYEAVGAAVSATSPIDVLVNCAGWDRVSRFLDTEPALWTKLIDINLRGVLNLCHHVLPTMAERKAGTVINIASDAGRVGSSGEAVYSACKGGIIAFTKSIARELASRQVTVNAICPGPTDTPLLDAFRTEGGDYGKKIYDGLKRAIPLRRLGEPDDVAGIAAFFASDEASFITGQVISVSGGLTMAG